MSILSSRIFRLGGVFIIGCLTALSMAPFHILFPWFLAIPVLIKLLDRESLGSSFILGWLFAFGYFVVSLYWIGIAFLVDADAYVWMMPFAVVGLPAYLAIFWGLGCLWAKILWTQNVFRVFTLAGSLTFSEYLRGYLLTGFPWNVPGYAFFAFNELVQLASFVGLWGLTFILFLGASLPIILLERRYRLSFVWLIALFGLIFIGHQRLEPASADDEIINVRIVQPSVPQSDKWRDENRPLIFQELLSLTSLPGIEHQDLVIWPESAFPGLIDEDLAARLAIARVLPMESFLVTGSIRRHIVGNVVSAEDIIYNSIFVLNSEGEIRGQYDKFHLVPWGEYLPFEKLLTQFGLHRLVKLPGSFKVGPGPQTLDFSSLPPFSPLICYEIIFPSKVVAKERPAFLLNVTNDGWFGNSTGPWQHLDKARMRAIEQGLPVLRAANTGISAIINSNGIVVASTNINSKQILDSILPSALSGTFYAHFGDWPVFVVIFSILFVAILKKSTIKKRADI